MLVHGLPFQLTGRLRSLQPYPHCALPEAATRLGRPIAKTSEFVICFWGVDLEGCLKGGVGFFQSD